MPYVFTLQVYTWIPDPDVSNPVGPIPFVKVKRFAGDNHLKPPIFRPLLANPPAQPANVRDNFRTKFTMQFAFDPASIQAHVNGQISISNVNAQVGATVGLDVNQAPQWNATASWSKNPCLVGNQWVTYTGNNAQGHIALATSGSIGNPYFAGYCPEISWTVMMRIEFNAAGFQRVAPVLRPGKVTNPHENLNAQYLRKTDQIVAQQPLFSIPHSTVNDYNYIICKDFPSYVIRLHVQDTGPGGQAVEKKIFTRKVQPGSDPKGLMNDAKAYFAQCYF